MDYFIGNTLAILKKMGFWGFGGDSGLSAYRLAMDQLSRAVVERRRFLLDTMVQEHAT
jgi:hypothetical protein